MDFIKQLGKSGHKINMNEALRFAQSTQQGTRVCQCQVPGCEASVLIDKVFEHGFATGSAFDTPCFDYKTMYKKLDHYKFQARVKKQYKTSFNLTNLKLGILQWVKDNSKSMTREHRRYLIDLAINYITKDKAPQNPKSPYKHGFERANVRK